MNPPKLVTDPTKPEAAAEEPKKARRRFTPEERIRNREDEIRRIKLQQQERVRERIDEVEIELQVCAEAAESAGMADDAKRCARARDALMSKAEKEADQ